MISHDHRISEHSFDTSGIRLRAPGNLSSPRKISSRDRGYSKDIFRAGYMKPLMNREFLVGSRLRTTLVSSGEDFLFYAHLFSSTTALYRHKLRRIRLPPQTGLTQSIRATSAAFMQSSGDRILSEFRSQLSVRSRSALAARSRDFEDVANAMPAINALRQRNWMRLALRLIKRPSVVGTGIRLLRTRASRWWSAFRRRAGPGQPTGRSFPRSLH